MAPAVVVFVVIIVVAVVAAAKFFLPPPILMLLIRRLLGPLRAAPQLSGAFGTPWRQEFIAAGFFLGLPPEAGAFWGLRRGEPRRLAPSSIDLPPPRSPL